MNLVLSVARIVKRVGMLPFRVPHEKSRSSRQSELSLKFENGCFAENKKASKWLWRLLEKQGFMSLNKSLK